MKIEHIAFQVLDPVAVAAWYVEHLGMRIVRKADAAPFAHFLADEGGSIVEIYNNPKASVPNYADVHSLHLHIALLADDIEATCERLVGAGCRIEEAPLELPTGDTLAMLRDPWNLPLQLVKRARPML